jgi:hypothetical protein
MLLPVRVVWLVASRNIVLLVAERVGRISKILRGEVSNAINQFIVKNSSTRNRARGDTDISSCPDDRITDPALNVESFEFY